MPVSELVEFTGGISTATAPNLMPINEALVSINTLLREGSLKSAPAEKPLATISGRYFYTFNGVKYYYNTLRSNVLWDNKWYWADGDEVKKVLPTGVEKSLGIEAPTSELIAAAGAGAKPHTGTFNYTYTYYDEDLGVESAPVELSNSLTVTNKDIVLTGFQTLHPTDATHFRLYRVGGYLSEFTLVAQLPLNTTTYTDTLDVTQIDGRLLQTLRTSTPPDGLKHLVEFNGRLYGSVGNIVYYSAIGNPDAWYPDDFFVFNSSITGLGTTSAGLVVFTQFTTNILRGTDPSNFYIKELSSNVGCISHFSIAQYQDIVMWLSLEAFCTTDGYSITDLTSNKIRNISGMYPRGTAVKNLTYYMSFGPILTPSTTLFPSTTLYPNKVIGGSVLSEGIVCINFNLGRQYSYNILEGIGIGNLGISYSNIYAGYQKSTVAFQDCSYRLQVDYFLPVTNYIADIDSLNAPSRVLKYLSPILTEGTISTLKEYEKVRIVYSGEFTVKVMLDGYGEVVSYTFDDSNSTDGFISIGIPNDKNKGYGIQFYVEGKGTIKSIQYTWQPRSIP